MIYLASPYSHPNSAVRESRFRRVCKAAAGLIAGGCNVFSPIAHSHPIEKYGELPPDVDWIRMDEEHMERCDSLYILMLDGWKKSIGVAAEIKMAKKFGIPIVYLDPLGMYK